jgi:hypothetical protein
VGAVVGGCDDIEFLARIRRTRTARRLSYDSDDVEYDEYDATIDENDTVSIGCHDDDNFDGDDAIGPNATIAIATIADNDDDDDELRHGTNDDEIEKTEVDEERRGLGGREDNEDPMPLGMESGWANFGRKSLLLLPPSWASYYSSYSTPSSSSSTAAASRSRRPSSSNDDDNDDGGYGAIDVECRLDDDEPVDACDDHATMIVDGDGTRTTLEVSTGKPSIRGSVVARLRSVLRGMMKDDALERRTEVVVGDGVVDDDGAMTMASSAPDEPCDVDGVTTVVPSSDDETSDQNDVVGADNDIDDDGGGDTGSKRRRRRHGMTSNRNDPAMASPSSSSPVPIFASLESKDIDSTTLIKKRIWERRRRRVMVAIGAAKNAVGLFVVIFFAGNVSFVCPRFIIFQCPSPRRKWNTLNPPSLHSSNAVRIM